MVVLMLGRGSLPGRWFLFGIRQSPRWLRSASLRLRHRWMHVAVGSHWFADGGIGWLAVVRRVELPAIRLIAFGVLHLRAHARGNRFVPCGFFLRGGLTLHTV